MFAQERFQEIDRLLQKERRLSVQALQRTLKVSPATLRRDLAELEKEQRVVRVHGGVMHPNYLRGEPTFDQKTAQGMEEKRKMARAAAMLIPDHATVFVDSGTSCLEAGRLLGERKTLTVITNSVPLAHLLATAKARVLCLGGELRGISGAMVGAFALSWLESLRADWALIGASGLDAGEGISTTEISEAAIKRQFLARASKKVLLADSLKWSKPSTIQFAPWDQFDFWITSPGVPSAAAKAIQKRGPRVTIV
jgi:DeoR family fructose operon transcriptional repressor